MTLTTRKAVQCGIPSERELCLCRSNEIAALDGVAPRAERHVVHDVDLTSGSDNSVLFELEPIEIHGHDREASACREHGQALD